MKKFVASLLFLGLGVTPAALAKADAIPYPTPGVIAPEIATYASGNNGISLYFYGSGASFTDTISVLDLNTGFTSGNILNNHTSVQGDMVTVGANGGILMGDQLVFFINSPEGVFANVASRSSDGLNHGYVTTYSADPMVAGIPAGLFVGLEDETSTHPSDFNYNDDTFVFTGVSANVTPEPGSLALLGTGTLSLLGMARRRFLRA